MTRIKHVSGIEDGKQIRWLEFVDEYDFEIKLIKGKENKVVDALSRRVNIMHVTTINVFKSNLEV